jgi:prepilin-type N-terminal cleavage/methylation domain-containing protein
MSLLEQQLDNQATHLAHKQGFTIMEIVIAMAIFTFSFLGILHTQYRATHSVAYNRSLTNATQLGQAVADSLEMMGIHSVGWSNEEEFTRNWNGKEYTITLSIDTGLTHVAAGKNIVVSKRATVDVAWKIGSKDYKTKVISEIQ